MYDNLNQENLSIAKKILEDLDKKKVIYILSEGEDKTLEIGKIFEKDGVVSIQQVKMNDSPDPTDVIILKDEKRLPYIKLIIENLKDGELFD